MDILEEFQQTYNLAKEFDPNMSFIISKSNNKNLVAYSSELVDGKFSLQKPIKKYWQTWDEKEEDQSLPTHKLNQIEKRLAYGINYNEKSENKLSFTINAYKSLPISIEIINDKVLTKLIFSGMEYHLLGIYAHIEGAISTKMKPKGISLVVKLPISEPDADELILSPPFPIYIDGNTKID